MLSLTLTRAERLLYAMTTFTSVIPSHTQRFRCVYITELSFSLSDLARERHKQLSLPFVTLNDNTGSFFEGTVYGMVYCTVRL